MGPDRFSRVALYIALAAALLGVIVLPSEAATEPARALLTIADGPVELLRGAARHGAVEGLALADNDIVRTGRQTRVARIEFADGRVLDLGPDTQALLLSDAAAAAQGLGAPAVLMIQGWAKLAVPAAVNAGAGPGARLAAPRISVVAAPAGSVLLHVEPDGDTLLFAEARAATVWRRAGPGQAVAAIETTLREGEVWSRPAASTVGTVSVGAATAALQGVPRALADTLPRRAARFQGREVDPTGGEALEASDLAGWMRAEPALLAALRPRLAALAREASAARLSTTVRPSLSPSGNAPRKPSTVTAAAWRPAPAKAAAREPKVVPGLALRPLALPQARVASIALEPTVLLATEHVDTSLPAATDAPKRR